MNDHLTNDLLVGALDGELSNSESALVESHLPDCEHCTQRYAALRLLSVRIESIIAGAAPEILKADREALAERLDSAGIPAARDKSHRSVVRILRWSGGIAAAILLAMLFAPHLVHVSTQSQMAALPSRSAALEVDGETFIPLPYSNPDLPMSAPHIVEMQVPVSSLASAGLVFEPVANTAAGAEPSVLADVLLGTDGQPLGVHVLSVE